MGHWHHRLHRGTRQFHILTSAVRYLIKRSNVTDENHAVIYAVGTLQLGVLPRDCHTLAGAWKRDLALGIAPQLRVSHCRAIFSLEPVALVAEAGEHGLRRAGGGIEQALDLLLGGRQRQATSAVFAVARAALALSGCDGQRAEAGAGAAEVFSGTVHLEIGRRVVLTGNGRE